jgi:HD-GYP domain-containing protein (c-di-GMP phosphodiesterase class II)
MTDPLLESADSAPDSPNYLRAVTDLAERRAVVTQDAIYSDNGIKLVEKGARIDGRLYDRLVQHKLREPIDRHLTVENAVDAAALVSAAQQMMQTSGLIRMMAQSLSAPERMVVPLRHMPLVGPIAFKLTLMREQRPDLFDHSLQMALVAMFLGIKSGMGERECIPLVAAALLHDMGVLHMAPEWRDRKNKVTGAERKQLVAHPITAMLMVRDAQVYPRSVEMAVLEHHERMDGTGYPRGLAGAQISPLGRILLLAEVVSAFFEKNTETPGQQLSLALRLNHRKFPSELVGHVLPLLQDDADHHNEQNLPVGDRVNALAATLADAFRQWEQAKTENSTAQNQPLRDGPASFIEERLRSLQRALIEAGAHPEYQAELLKQLSEDPDESAEFAYVIQEALWQLESIVNGCQRRWPDELEKKKTPDAVLVAGWCEWVRSRTAA